MSPRDAPAKDEDAHSLAAELRKMTPMQPIASSVCTEACWAERPHLRVPVWTKPLPESRQ